MRLARVSYINEKGIKVREGSVFKRSFKKHPLRNTKGFILFFAKSHNKSPI